MVAPTVDSGGGAGSGTPSGQVSGQALYVAAALIGFFLVPMFASMQPELVNGFLLLVLMSALLLNRDRWLPYMAKLNPSK